MGRPTSDLAGLWEWFAQTQCRGYSPLYERIALEVAGDRDVLGLLDEAPPASHMPPALLAAVHYLLLDGLNHPLAAVYEGGSDADPGPLFRDVCLTRREDVLSILATRRIQTNECGRSAIIGPGLTWLARELDGPLTLVDVGSSAGLNLLCDSYRLDYDERGVTGPADSPVTVECRVTGGDPPIAERLPPLAGRIGIDRSPIDLTDPGDARWLLACVWPDTGRHHRTSAAIELARRDPPAVLLGSANEVLPALLGELPSGSAAVVLTTWVFGYFSLEERRQFVEILNEGSQRRRIGWLFAEGAGVVEGFSPDGASSAGDGQAPEPDVFGATLFDRGVSRPVLLGYAHPHGRWIDWRAGPQP